MSNKSIVIFLDDRKNDGKAVLLKVIQRCECKVDSAKNFVLIASVDYKIPLFLRENRNFHGWAQPLFVSNGAAEKKGHGIVIF